MRTKLIVSAVAASTLAGSITTAQAYTIEHVGTDCRVNYSITEMQNNRMYFPVYYTQDEVKKFKKESLDAIAEAESELKSEKSRSDANKDLVQELTERIADEKGQLEIYDKCAKVPASKPAPVEDGSSTSAVLAGVLGGFIGAVLTIAAMIGLKDVLPFKF
ncbi:hypothetical protein [Corynebacterium haemomassiliense]|uniref:Secreted protein n=1 Tax=Corynebacterium haemomassiliense TaxID=2754726 RepID=A0A7W2E970_9CORY|nr:hypothetical protein [Corynebacterium haemomassiliense]MBA5243450.1 hypothetical protein [Corynebacterium haemomassiliense]MDL0402113.1 hypothetical protein [Corynebacterium lehmanniae]